MGLRILVLRADEDDLGPATEAELPALLTEPRNLVWVDMWSPGPRERALLEDVFGAHPAIVADMLGDAPLPKIEHVDGALYVVLENVLQRVRPGAREVETEDADFLLGPGWLVSSRSEHCAAVDAALASLRRQPVALRSGGAAHALYRLASAIVEGFAPLATALEGESDALETRLARSPGPEVLEAVLAAKHRLRRLRRVMVHQRDVLDRLARDDSGLVPAEVRPFLRDAHDRFVRLADRVDAARELTDGALEAYISINAHKMNEVMKVLTLSSTIMLPLSFIAGLYGMNFEVMPELHWRCGYVVALVAMGATATTLAAYFRRKGWL